MSRWKKRVLLGSSVTFTQHVSELEGRKVFNKVGRHFLGAEARTNRTRGRDVSGAVDGRVVGKHTSAWPRVSCRRNKSSFKEASESEMTLDSLPLAQNSAA